MTDGSVQCVVKQPFMRGLSHMNTNKRIRRQAVSESAVWICFGVHRASAESRTCCQCHVMLHLIMRKHSSASQSRSVAHLIAMSKLCISVSATEPNSTLCKLRSTVDILEVGIPIEKVTKASDRIYHLIS